jgi:pSer/pThr/pTyr-binding forkhead associated (FHA) protein
MVIRFVVLAPDSKKGSFAVRLPIIVGRSEEAKFRIQQDRVSRKHCEFFSADGRVFIRDLGSTNGTFLEDEQVPTSAKVQVPSGAVVRVGSLVFRVDYEEATDGTTTATGPRIDEADEAMLDTQSTGDDGDVAGVNLEPTDEAEPPPPVTEDAPDESAGPVFTDAPATGDDELEPEEEPADLDAALEGLPAATDAEPPSAEGFAFLESATAAPAEPPAGEELQWLPPDDDAGADTPDDDKLGDFFKGLQ